MEVSSHYERTGIFKIHNQKEGKVYDGDFMDCTRRNGTLITSYRINGTLVAITSGMVVREISEYRERNFITKRDLPAYLEPFDEYLQQTTIIPAGRYKSTRASLDFVEIEYDGNKFWVLAQYIGENYTDVNYGEYENSLKQLPVDAIDGIPIQQMWMKIRVDKRPGYAIVPRYITIHNTGNYSPTADALAHARMQLNDARAWVSWHFSVDDKSIYQSLPLDESGYHAGDGILAGNATTIGIEICEHIPELYPQAEKNAALLAAHLLWYLDLSSDAIRMHKDWSGKNCPKNIIEGTKGTMGWNRFKEVVKEEYERIKNTK